MNNSYYLPVKTANLGFYFSKGIIIPSTYIDGWIYDIQAKFNQSLLLTTNPFTNESNCSLTMVFSDDELKDIKQISDHFFIYNKPLAISRIKHINFSDNKQSEVTVYNIETGDAFVPKELIRIVDKNEIANSSELNFIEDIPVANEWRDKIDRYNRLLGGLSLLQIAGFQDLEYPTNYFKYFSEINIYAEEQIRKLNFESVESLKTSLDFTMNHPKINKNIVESFANKEGVELPVKKGLIKFENIDTNKKSYILSILATYGEDTGKPKKASDFISALVGGKFSSEIKEKICFMFGLNQGYSVFRNKYKINDKTINTKFELNSEVDYTIIESVYQYVFNGIEDNTNFPYISEWCPINKKTTDLQKYETYEIFDKEIVYKKKVLFAAEDYFQKFSQYFSEDNVFDPIKKAIVEVVQGTLKKITDDFEKKQKEMDISIGILNEEKRKLENENSKLQIELKQLSSNSNPKNNEDVDLNENLSKVDPIVTLRKEMDKQIIRLEEEKETLKSKNHKLQIELEQLSCNSNLINSADVPSDNKSDITSTDILKDIAQEIKSISDLHTIAKYVGLADYKSYKKGDIETLRKKIIEHQGLL